MEASIKPTTTKSKTGAIPRKQAKEEIVQYFAERSEGLVHTGDIWEDLNLDIDLIIDICRELEESGQITGYNVEYSIHTKVAALLKTADADLLKRFVDVLFEKHYDPEPLSPREAQAIKESEEALARGEFITLEEFEREHGL